MVKFTAIHCLSSNGLDQEVLLPYGLYGPLEQVNWSAGKADLAWSPFSKVSVYGKFDFIASTQIPHWLCCAVHDIVWRIYRFSD